MALNLKKSAIDKVRDQAPAEKMHTILLVDDEESNLTSLSRILPPSYGVLTAKDGKQALELIQSHDSPSAIHLIISDQRMPRMTGVEFLKETIPIIPKTIRMILTGFTDIDAIISSINEGQIYKFLTKPVEPQELVVTVQRALEAYELEQKNHRLVEELKVLNASLEHKVTERTRELKETLALVEKKNRQISKHRDKMEYIAKIDGLTDIPNRRRFDEVLADEWRRAKRSSTSLSLAMIDIDFFKQYNDTYGHAVGDTCLRQVAQALSGVEKRPGDFIARYGGEEFAVILPESTADKASAVVSRMRDSIWDLKIPHEGSKIHDRLTVSIGLASMVPHGDNSPELLVQSADRMLYSAKKNGRNRIEILS